MSCWSTCSTAIGSFILPALVASAVDPYAGILDASGGGYAFTGAHFVVKKQFTSNV